MLREVHRVHSHHSPREDLSVSLSSLVSDRTGRPVGDRAVQPVEQRNQEAQIRTLLDKQKKQILAECQARISQHEIQAARAEEEQRLLLGLLWQQNLELREAHQRGLTEMEELWKFQSSTFDTIARGKLVEDQNTILELSGRIQELQNEVNCMNDSKDFQDAQSFRSGNSHVTSRPVSFTPHPIPGGMLSRSFGVPSRKEGPPSTWDTHGISGNVFLQIQMRLLQHFLRKSWINGIHRSRSRFIHPQWREVKGKKIKIWNASLDRQPKIQSSSVEETLQRIMVQTNNDCRFWIFISANFLHQPRLLAGR